MYYRQTRRRVVAAAAAAVVVVVAAGVVVLFNFPEPQNHEKTQCFATFLPFRAPASSFFWSFLFWLFSLLTAFSPLHIVGSLTSELPPIKTIYYKYKTLVCIISFVLLFTHRTFYTQTLLHRSCCTQELLHKETFTHKRFYTQTLLHTEVFATALSLQKSFNWFLLPIFWWEPQVDAEMHLKQYCRHLSSVDMVLHSFFGDCVLWVGTAAMKVDICFLFRWHVTCDCKDRFVFARHRHVLALHFSCCLFLLVLTKQLAPTRLAPRWPVVGDANTHNLRPTFWR